MALAPQPEMLTVEQQVGMPGSGGRFLKNKTLFPNWQSLT
jgi:hypothetical protein